MIRRSLGVFRRCFIRLGPKGEVERRPRLRLRAPRTWTSQLGGGTSPKGPTATKGDEPRNIELDNTALRLYCLLSLPLRSKRGRRLLFEFSARLIIQVAAVLIACFASYALERPSDSFWVLFIAASFGIPGIIIIFAIFIPVELAGRKRNVRWFSLSLIPFLGALIPWLLFPFAGNLQNFISGTELISGLGFAWGFLWVATWPTYLLLKTCQGKFSRA